MKELIKNFRFAWKYAKYQKKKMFLYMFCNVLQIIISVVLPIVSAQIIVHLTNNMLLQVLNMSLVLLLAEWGRNFLNYFSTYSANKVYTETFSLIQIDLGSEILKLENSCLDATSSGVFIQRLIGDTSSIADIFNILNGYLTQILTNIGIIGAIFIINKKVFLFILLYILVIYLVEGRRLKYMNERDKEYREQKELAAGFVSELVRGVRDIKMLSAEESFIGELKTKIFELNKFRYRMLSTNRNYNFICGTFLDLFNTALIFLLVYFIFTGELTGATALVIHNYMGRIASVVDFFSMLLEQFKNFNLSASRVFEVIESKKFEKEKFGSKHLDKVTGDFEFKNVSFSYDEKTPVLNDISFKVSKSERVAFVGKSGSGKSTIFSLLCKMYSVNSGVITIDGENIEELDKESIRDNITIISQSPYIFNLSIRDNLRLVKKDLTDEEMIRACKMACLDDFISGLSDGYDTIVGEGGVNLSGGERQRLAIARALVQKTQIILFDEATSALDNETQEAISDAINNLEKDYTILIIAHRLSTVIDSDRILFLNDGKIEASGSHKELLKTSQGYRSLYEAELKEVED